MTKRSTRRIARRRISPEAVDAYRARDLHALHRALGLQPFECSPLPLEDEPLGCNQEPYPFDDPHSPWAASWPQAQAYQVELEKALKE